MIDTQPKLKIDQEALKRDVDDQLAYFVKAQVQLEQSIRQRIKDYSVVDLLQFADFQVSLANMNTKLDVSLANMNTKIDGLTTEIKTLSDKVTGLSTDVQNLQEGILLLRTTIPAPPHQRAVELFDLWQENLQRPSAPAPPASANAKKPSPPAKRPDAKPISPAKKQKAHSKPQEHSQE